VKIAKTATPRRFHAKVTFALNPRQPARASRIIPGMDNHTDHAAELPVLREPRITTKKGALAAIKEIEALMRPYAETQDTAASLLKGCKYWRRELAPAPGGYVTFGFASGQTYSSIAMALSSARSNVDYYQRNPAPIAPTTPEVQG
jgi:hypothetical protein